jgi:hypothetical protein
MADYNYLDSQLKLLISSPSGWLTQDELKEVGDFIEAGEYGVALETLCSILTEELKEVPQEKYQQIMELGQAMGIEEENWLQLRSLVAWQ